MASQFLLVSKSWSAIGKFESYDQNSKIRLIASYQDQSHSNKILVGFHFKLKNDWKIYGKSDSSFTQPPVFDFSNSTNIDQNNFKILWPEAKIISEKILDEIISYPVYENEVIIPLEISVKEQKKPININVKIDYGLCKDVCIPASQNLNISIKAGEYDQKALELIEDQQVASDKKELGSKSSYKGNLTLIGAIIISFIGGLILNIMPCVLPVLSIKLLSVINHSKSSLKKIRIAYSSTLLGILFCFFIFAVITAILKILGNNIGWGVQFQNPYFLIFLIVILTIFTSNLLGLFEINIGQIGSFISSKLNNKIVQKSKSDHISHVIISNFLSGILAVLLATPCSAPFLGTAISFAFSQDAITIFIIFLTMGLGLAFPYIILIAFPNLVHLLPKPGDWMNSTKNLMAGFLGATIIWLVYILINNIGFISAILVAIISSLIFLCFKICHKFNIKKTTELIVILFLIITCFFVPIKIGQYFSVKERQYNELWIKFDENKISNYIDDGKVVIIDITADWCLTCKVNKKLVLDSDEIVNIIKEDNVIAMRGDITTPQQEISEFMATHNRYAIPFNIVYGPNAKNGILASELLSKKHLINIIKQAR